MDDVLKKLRKEALYLTHKCQDGNLQSVFSCLDVVWTLYDRIMNWSVEKATVIFSSSARDRQRWLCFLC